MLLTSGTGKRKLAPAKKSSRAARDAAFDALNRSIVRCRKCPRLREHCLTIARVKKREFREWTYWGKPVPGFGDLDAQVWILGLAPAAHGANRTGRVFTGDSSGNWLFRALHRAGFANQPHSTSLTDGLVLKNAYISASARCAPPDNKPTPEEIARCSPFLDVEWQLLERKRLFVALGGIGFASILRLLEKKGVSLPVPRPKFAHGASFEAGPYVVLASYHPSRQNTQTGRLTEAMWDEIFFRARDLVAASA